MHHPRIEAHGRTATEHARIGDTRELIDGGAQRPGEAVVAERALLVHRAQQVHGARHVEGGRRQRGRPEQRLQIATADTPGARRAHDRLERVGDAGEAQLASFSGERGLQIELLGHAISLDAAHGTAAERHVGVRARQRGVRQRHRLQVHVELHALCHQRIAPVTGESRWLARAIHQLNIRLAETRIVPQRIEAHGAAGETTQLREHRVHVPRRAEIDLVDDEIDPLQDRFGGLEDVELPTRLSSRDRAWHMLVGEGELRLVERPVGHIPTPGAHRPAKGPAPVVRERLAVEPLQQIGVRRFQRQVHVGQPRDEPAHAPRHAATQSGLERPRIHVGDGVVDDVEVLRIVAHGQERAAAPGMRHRFVDPREITQRHAVEAQTHVVAHGETASPHDLRPTARRAARQVEMRVLHPERIADAAEVAGKVLEPEGRIHPHHIEPSHGEMHPDGVGIGQPGSAEVEISTHETVDAHIPAVLPADFAIEPGEIERQRTVALRALQRVSELPRHAHHERHFVERRGVDHDVLAEAARTRCLLLATITLQRATPVPVVLAIVDKCDHRSRHLE